MGTGDERDAAAGRVPVRQLSGYANGMRLALAALGTVGGLAAAIAAAALWHWQLAVILVGLLVAYFSATQVDVDVPVVEEVDEVDVLG